MKSRGVVGDILSISFYDQISSRYNQDQETIERGALYAFVVELLPCKHSQMENGSMSIFNSSQ